MEDKNEVLKCELDSFLEINKVPKEEKIVISSKSGLFERIEKKLITEDGRELLTERIF